MPLRSTRSHLTVLTLIDDEEGRRIYSREVNPITMVLFQVFVYLNLCRRMHLLQAYASSADNAGFTFCIHPSFMIQVPDWVGSAARGPRAPTRPHVPGTSYGTIKVHTGISASSLFSNNSVETQHRTRVIELLEEYIRREKMEGVLYENVETVFREARRLSSLWPRGLRHA